MIKKIKNFNHSDVTYKEIDELENFIGEFEQGWSDNSEVLII